MLTDQKEEFFGPDPAPFRARAKLKTEYRSIIVGIVFAALSFWFLRELFSQERFSVKDFQKYVGLIFLIPVAVFCLTSGSVGAYRLSRQLAAFKAHPPADVLWYFLDENGLHLCEMLTHTPSGGCALFRWSEMFSVELVNEAEPVARVTTAGGQSILDLMANHSRRDGATLGERLKVRFDRKGKAEDPKSEEQGVTLSDEEIARIEEILAQARLPREPVFGPDGGPVVEPPPPCEPVETPVRDDQLPHPPLPWRTVP